MYIPARSDNWKVDKKHNLASFSLSCCTQLNGVGFSLSTIMSCRHWLSLSLGFQNKTRHWRGGFLLPILWVKQSYYWTRSQLIKHLYTAADQPQSFTFFLTSSARLQDDSNIPHQKLCTKFKSNRIALAIRFVAVATQFLSKWPKNVIVGKIVLLIFSC